MRSDLTPFEERPLINAFAIDGGLSSCIACRFLDADVFCSSSAGVSDDELGKFLNNKFDLRYLFGSDGFHHRIDPPTSVLIGIQHLFAFLARAGNAISMVDIVEFFGGEGGVRKLCVRRRLKCGRNFGIVTRVDLTNERGISEMF